MKRKAYLALLLALTCSCFVMLGGCGKNDKGLPSSSSVAVSVEDAEVDAYQGIVDGTITLHTRWYAVDGSRLVGATVTYYKGAEVLSIGTTNENGILNAFDLPANTELTVVVTDAAGAQIAQSTVSYNMDTSFAALTVVPIHMEDDSEEVPTLVFQINPAQRNISSSIFITADGHTSVANIYPYVEGFETEGEIAPAVEGGVIEEGTPEEGAPAEGEGAPAEGEGAPAEGEAAPAE